MRQKTLHLSLVILWLLLLGSTTSVWSQTVIRTAAQLTSLTDGGNYVLGQDIIITSTAGTKTNITLDGAGYTVTLNMGTSCTMFSGLTGSTVKNLHVRANGTGSTNGILATSVTNGTIQNVRVSSNAAVAGSTSYIGGLVSYATGTTFTNCRSNVNVTGTGVPTGGLIGTANNCTVRESFASGDVTSNAANLGGLIGNVTGTSNEVSNCYALGHVKNTASIGGITNSLPYSALNRTDLAYSGNRPTIPSGCLNNGVIYTASVTETGYQEINPSPATATLQIWNPANLATGGLVGSFAGGTVTNCYAAGNIEVNNRQTYQGHFSTYGLKGRQTGTRTVSRQYQNCSWYDTNYSYTTITNWSTTTPATAFATDTDTAYAAGIGGIVGSRTAGTISNNVWLGKAFDATGDIPCYVADLTNTHKTYTNHSGQSSFDHTFHERKGGFSLIAGNSACSLLTGNVQSRVDKTTAITSQPGTAITPYSNAGFSITATPGTGSTTWIINAGKSLPVLRSSLIDMIPYNYYHQDSLCSKVDYGYRPGQHTPGADYTWPTGYGDSLKILKHVPVAFKFTGSLDDLNAKFSGSNLLYLYRYRSGGNADFVPTSLWSASGLSKPGTYPTDTINRTNDGVEPIALSTPAGQKGELYIDVIADGFVNYQITGSPTLHCATVQPRPTVAWKGYLDAVEGHVFDWTNVQIDDYYNTLCYDYRDLGPYNVTGVNQFDYDSAYIKVELSGTPPFSFSYKEFWIDNGNGYGDNTTMWVHRKSTVSNTTDHDNDKLFAHAAPNQPFQAYNHMYYFDVFAVLHNKHVQDTYRDVNYRVHGGDQPSYTGYNLIDSTRTAYTNINTITPYQDLYRVEDAYCKSEVSKQDHDHVSGTQDPWWDQYAWGYTEFSGPTQSFHYTYTPRDGKSGDSSAPAVGVGPAAYDTLIQNPLPVMNFPYEMYHGLEYLRKGELNTPVFHNDSIVCEGDTIRQITFSSPLIVNFQKFRDSMHYEWRWIDVNDPTTTVTVNPFKYGNWSLDINPPFTELAAYQDVHNYGPIEPYGPKSDKDSIALLQNDPLSAIRSAADSYLPIQGYDLFPQFETNDDHLSDSAHFMQYPYSRMMSYRDTVSRSFVRVTPFFVNELQGVCHAKTKNYGYLDFLDEMELTQNGNRRHPSVNGLDKAYRGVTDFGVTVNPRPHLFHPQLQIACNGIPTKAFQLRTHIRDDRFTPGMAAQIGGYPEYAGRADTVWYAIYNLYPSTGWVIEYDSISAVDVPRLDDAVMGKPGWKNGGIFSNYVKGTPVDPSRPYQVPSFGAFPIPSDSIPSFIARNSQRVPIYDSIRVIPYFKNRDYREKICMGRADTVRYKVNPVTTIVYDLDRYIDSTYHVHLVCDADKDTLRITAYGVSLSYHWYYRSDTLSPRQPIGDPSRQFLVVDKSGYYSVDIMGECLTTQSKEILVVFDDIPQFTLDLYEKDRVCAGENKKLQVSSPYIASYEWFKNDRSIGNNTDSLWIYNADFETDAGLYQVKATGYCGKVGYSTLSDLWVITPLTPENLVIQGPSEFEEGKEERLRIGNGFGYDDVLRYAWSYESYNSLQNNVIFRAYPEHPDMHDPYVKFHKADIGKITLDMTHACAPGGHYIVTKEIKVGDGGTGIEDVYNQSTSVYPNPVGNELNVVSKNPIRKVTVTDLNGKLIYSQQSENEHHLQIRSDGWAQGTYVIIVETNESREIYKIIKK